MPTEEGCFMKFPDSLRPRRPVTLVLLALAALGGGTARAQNADTTRVIVAFHPGAAGAGRAAIAAARGQVRHEIYGVDAVAIEVPVQALAGLSRNPNVEYVEEDVKRYPLSGSTPTTGTPYATGQQMPYGIAMVQADQLAATNASSRKVCIIDSGYDGAHEDLSHGANVTGEYDTG